MAEDLVEIRTGNTVWTVTRFDKMVAAHAQDVDFGAKLPVPAKIRNQNEGCVGHWVGTDQYGKPVTGLVLSDGINMLTWPLPPRTGNSVALFYPAA